MSDTVRGMIVYHRTTLCRGVVTAGNQVTGEIAVQWDDGARQLIHVSNLMSEKLYIEFKAEEYIKKEEERVRNMSIKAAQATIGAVVYQAGKTAPLTKGTIAGPVTAGLVIVEWESRYISKVDIKQLLSEADGIAENQRLVEEAAQLETEFDKIEKECAAKLAKAAALVAEADKLASDKGLELQEMYEATSVLQSAMSKAGWRTSSWNC